MNKNELLYEKYQNEFGIRLAKLRIEKGVSARDMSLSIGQNEGYINGIENGKSLPSMKTFFIICEYLNITPDDFFNNKSQYPDTIARIVHYLYKLDKDKLKHIGNVIEDLVV